MGDFTQQILVTLTSFPGNLVYHLILAFSIAGAFQAAWNLWRTSGFPQGRRMVIGLGLLLAARLILFIGAGLAGKAFADPRSLLPILDRSVTALSLILLTWLWAFPEPTRPADAAAGLLTLLTATATALSLFQWWGNEGDTFFNQTWLDIGWEVYSLALLILSITLLLARRPNAWGTGLAMFGILTVGHLFHLILPLQNSDISGGVRLVQLTAYPLLLALPHRFQIPTQIKTSYKESKPLIQERVRYSVSPQVFRSILSIGAQKSFPEVCKKMTQTIAEAMLADLCLALLPPNRDGQIIIQSGYDLILQKNIQGNVFEGHEVPLLLSAMERSLPLRLPASSTSRDLFSIGTKLQLGRAGHLLASFVTGGNHTPLLGIILLSPYSNRGWSKDDLDFLSDITDGLAQILQRSHQWRSLQDEVNKNRQNMKAFQALLEETQNENANLRTELSNLNQQALQEQSPEVVPLADISQQPSEKIKRLQAENLRLQELVENLLAENEAQQDTPGMEQLEEQLRLAIEEISHLQSRLETADQDLINLQSGSTAPTELSDHQIEVFTSIAQELRQPMSSIIGYTDLLLGESVGILGALQRKFLERVRASTERMQILLDDLFQIVSMGGGQLKLKPEITDLGNIIDEAILATSPQLRDRHIILRVDMPDQLPQFQADRDALGQVFFHLLKNAGDASPVEGEILLRASTYQTDNNQQYVLIQVADQGGGIPVDDLPRVFSRLYRADNPLIEGVGDTGVGLSIAKTLVEAHNGRIWVDTESGKGSTFSVLIPLLNGNPGDISL